MDRAVALTLISVLVTGLSHAFKDGTFPRGFRMPDSWRAVILSVLGVTSGAIDIFANGSDFQKAIMTSLATSGGGLVVLILEALGGGGSGPAASGGGVTSLPRPSKAPTFGGGAAMVGLAVMLALVPGCGFGRALEPQVGPGLVKALQWEQDAQGKLEQVQAAINLLVTDPKVRAAIQEKIDDVRAAIDVARSVTQGAKDLTDADLGGAFTEFRIAWQALVPLLKLAGFATPDGTRLMGAAPGTYHPPALPVPLALSR